MLEDTVHENAGDANAIVVAIIPVRRPAYLSENMLLDLHVTHVDGTDFEEGEWVGQVPRESLAIPVRIGRRDMNQQPYIRPELDLSDLLCRYSSDGAFVISRMHAVLELNAAGKVTLRPVSRQMPNTFVRRTGSCSYIQVSALTPLELHDRDVILLGSPQGRHVKMRVVFPHE
jgi:hypothetical protein